MNYKRKYECKFLSDRLRCSHEYSNKRRRVPISFVGSILIFFPPLRVIWWPTVAACLLFTVVYVIVKLQGRCLWTKDKWSPRRCSFSFLRSVIVDNLSASIKCIRGCSLAYVNIYFLFKLTISHTDTALLQKLSRSLMLLFHMDK